MFHNLEEGVGSFSGKFSMGMHGALQPVSTARGILWQVRVLLKAQNSTTTYGEATFEGIDDSWRRFSVNITANTTDSQAVVGLQLLQPGSILVDSLSLFPGGNIRDGWQNPYPFRQDLLQHLKDLKPRCGI